MTNAARKIFDDALALPEEERLQLVEALFHSLSAEARAEVDEAWREEVLRRVEEVRSGAVKLETWDDVRRAGREALERR